MEGQQFPGAPVPQTPQPPAPNSPMQPQTPMPPQPGQPQVPASPQPSATELPRHHVHNSYIWLGSVRAILAVLFALVIANFSTIVGLVAEEGIDGSEAGFMLALVGGGTLFFVVVIFALIAVIHVVNYKHLYFTVGPDEFTLCSGVFNKKKVHVPYQRVQSVDQRATLLQRIFGVCTVSIDTAGGAANKAVVVPYVTKAQAEWLRAELYNRKNALDAQMAGTAWTAGVSAGVAPVDAPGAVVPGAPQPGAVPGAPQPMAGVSGATALGAPVPATQPGNVLDVGAEVWNQAGGVFAGPAQDTGRVTYEYGLTNKELFLAGLSNTTSVGLIMAGLIVGILQIVSFAFDLMGDAANNAVEGALYMAGSQAAGALTVGIAGIVIVVVLVMWALSAVASCINYGGFKARRRNSRIEVEYGLLNHTFQGVDVDRVQSVVVKQSFIRRILGYCELSLGKIDAADDSQDTTRKGSLVQQGLVIHPFVKMSRVPEILAGIVPEFADLPREVKPVAKVALRRALVRRVIIQGSGFWLAVVAALILAFIAWMTGILESGAFVPDDGDAVFFGLVVSYGPAFAFILLALAVILAIIDAVGAVLWARESSFAYNRQFMQVSNGGLSRETVSFPRQKIQFGTLRANPLQRRAGTETLLATTAAGSGGTTTTLIDVPRTEALAWLDWLKPGGNRPAGPSNMVK